MCQYRVSVRYQHCETPNTTFIKKCRWYGEIDPREKRKINRITSYEQN